MPDTARDTDDVIKVVDRTADGRQVELADLLICPVCGHTDVRWRVLPNPPPPEPAAAPAGAPRRDPGEP